MEAHSYHPPQCGASAPSLLHPCIANANIISYIQSNQRKREWWGDSATDRDFNECFGCFYAVPMRVYGGSSEEREPEWSSKGGGGDYLARAGGNPNSLSGDILCALARSRFSRNLSPLHCTANAEFEGTQIFTANKYTCWFSGIVFRPSEPETPPFEANRHSVDRTKDHERLHLHFAKPNKTD